MLRVLGHVLTANSAWTRMAWAEAAVLSLERRSGLSNVLWDRSFSLLLSSKSIRAAYLHYLPVKAGARFSTKCATPSLKSSVLKLAIISRTEMSKASESGCDIASYTWRLITRSDRGLTVEASSRAYSWTLSRKASCGKTRFTSPTRRASVASIVRAEKQKIESVWNPHDPRQHPGHSILSDQAAPGECSAEARCIGS